MRYHTHNMADNTYLNIQTNQGKYIFILTLAYWITGILAQILSNEIIDYPILTCQIISTIAFFALIKIGLHCTLKHILIIIFFYQFIFSYCLSIFFVEYCDTIFGFNAVDSLLYNKIALATKGLEWAQSSKIISNYLTDISDHGFPYFLKVIYDIGQDTFTSELILIFCNVIFQCITCWLTMKICCYLNIQTYIIKWIVLLWGLNSCSVYLNCSGLKEPLFLMLCTMNLYLIYNCRKNPISTSTIIFTIFNASTLFFRPYITIFFLLIYIFSCVLPKFFDNHIKFILFSAFVICTIFTSLLTYIFPEIYYAILGAEEHGPKGASVYVYEVLSFLSPIPKFFSMDTPQTLLMIMFSIIKFGLSIFGLTAIFSILKNKKVEYYPLIYIYVFTVLLLIVSGHFVNYRYIYIILPSFFILIGYGFKVTKTIYLNAYLALSCVIIFLFNSHLY